MIYRPILARIRYTDIQRNRQRRSMTNSSRYYSSRYYSSRYYSYVR